MLISLKTWCKIWLNGKQLGICVYKSLIIDIRQYLSRYYVNHRLHWWNVGNRISAVAKLQGISMIILVKDINNPMENWTQLKKTSKQFSAVANKMFSYKLHLLLYATFFFFFFFFTFLTLKVKKDSICIVKTVYSIARCQRSLDNRNYIPAWTSELNYCNCIEITYWWYVLYNSFVEFYLNFNYLFIFL